jgi:glycosyltransferase involved in cell wall biosynthesis
MKVGIISHSPLWTTGFGVTSGRIARSLLDSGHIVCCFSLGETPVLSGQPPFNIYPAEWTSAYNDFSGFLNTESPDVLLINFDINAAGYFIRFCKLLKWKGKLFGHIVLDGFPVYETLLEPLKDLDGIIVPTKAAKKYLNSVGIKNIHYAPHGVSDDFIPLKSKKGTRLKLGLQGNLSHAFMIGVFAKNEERKQIPKILMALHHIVYNLKQKNILLYLHTQAQPDLNKGWDLEFIVDQLKLNRQVIFTAKNFRQDKGVERAFNAATNPDAKQLNYIERLNMCDVIVNIPFSGGFELCNIEAQACGIPLITIDDSGNIKEVVQESALLMQPALKNIWGNGATVYLVDEVELAERIIRIKNDPELQQSIRQKGFENARRFTWNKLEYTVKKIIGQLPVL